MKSRPILYSAPMALANIEGRKTQTRRIINPQPGMHDFGKGPVPALTGKHCSGGFLAVGIEKVVNEPGNSGLFKCPYGQVGDHLWGKETFFADGPEYFYRASGAIIGCHHWTPSIFMPRAASRIHQEILTLRVERVGDISPDDAEAEGVKPILEIGDFPDWQTTAPPGHQHVKSLNHIAPYRDLWNEINLKPSPIHRKNPTTGFKEIIGYKSHPWSIEDFDAAYPGVSERGKYQALPITITPNPWVWVIEYKPFQP